MRNTVAKRLRKEAELATIGKSKQVTRTKYKEIKRLYKSGIIISGHLPELEKQLEIKTTLS